MNRDQIICPCLDITAGQIMDAYKEGAKSVEAIKEVTGAGTACGACLDEIEELIQSCNYKEMLFDVFEQHLIYCIGDFVEISYAIKKEPLLRDSHQMPMVGLEPTRP